MKKNIIIVIVLGALIGYLFGSIIFKNYQGIEYMNNDGNIYYVQYGVYTSEDAAINNITNLDNYKIIELDDKYYVYLGVTTDYDIALKIQDMYKEKDIYTYIRSDYVSNSETLSLLQEFDNKLKDDSSSEEIQSVMKEIFENQQIIL